MRSDARQLPALALLALVVLVYANSLHGDFQFDDYHVIVDNPAVHTWSAWYAAMPGIRPLLKLSYTFNWIASSWISGSRQPFGFHLFNLFCHAANTLLVFALCRIVLRPQPFLQQREAANPERAAWIAAALFALHPAQTEAVTYICGRSVTLMSLFYLGSLYTACDERRAYRQLVSPLLFMAALLTKETAWTLPFALGLINAARSLSMRESWRRIRVHVFTLCALAAVILAIPAYRRMLGHSLSIRPLFDNLLLQVDGWWYLMTRPPLLLQTNIDPDLPVRPTFDASWSIRCALLLALLSLGFLLRQRRSGLALLWFFLHLLPTNSLLPRNDIANDRQLYLALIGPALIVGSVFCAVLSQRVGTLVVALSIMVLALATIARNRDYRDEITLWQATTLRSPQKARVWNNLGYAYQIAGRNDDALAAYRRALVLNPEYDRARVNLRLLVPTAD